MEHLDIVIVGLLVAVAGLALLARLLHIPYPIFLVIGGLVIGFLPGVPKIELPPDMVLLIFLPPLLTRRRFSLPYATLGPTFARSRYLPSGSWSQPRCLSQQRHTGSSASRGRWPSSWGRSSRPPTPLHRQRSSAAWASPAGLLRS